MQTDDAPVFPEGDPANCPVERTLRLLDGRWRLMVLFRLGGRGPTRWGALRRSLAPITPRVLTATLRQLETDGLIWRDTQATVPPIVTYGLTEKGAALSPVFAAMAAWGQRHD
ncbi:winged helix-turn-helix transcriptional regulator [Yoonia sp.]|uniref:winged helix-turn-helix transcriptional regulator n=1 Tax=Yoonia sp. TaxID=2212373 RepID=UPI002FD98D5B